MATVATVLIVPLLAYLQYQWLGQLSERESERMRGNARMAAFRCSMEFSQELTGLMKSLSGTIRGSDDEVRSELLSRIHFWKETATHPLLVTGDVTVSSLPDADLITPVAVDERTSLFIFKDLSAIAIPIQGRPQFLGIVSLNLQQITSSYLPELIRTNFGSDGAVAYDFVIIDRNGVPFFRQTQASVKGNLENANVSMQFLTLPPRPLSRIPSEPPDRMPYGPRPGETMKPEEQMPEGVQNGRRPPMMRGPDGQQAGGRGMGLQGLYELRVSHRDGSLEAAAA